MPWNRPVTALGGHVDVEFGGKGEIRNLEADSLRPAEIRRRLQFIADGIDG